MTGAMRAVAAVLLIALFMALTVLAIGSWSCSQQAISRGETAQAETAAKRDCSTVGGTFAAGLNDAGAFVRAYHPEIAAIGIVVIAIFSVILGAFTISLAGSTRVAAGAALLNARAVLEAERARLHVVIERETIGKLASWADDPGDRDDDRVANLEIAYSFKNYGKTPALIHEIGHKVVIQSTLPKERAYSLPAPLPIEPVIGAAATSAPITDVGIPDVTVGTARAIRDSQATLWFYGYVVYDDTYGWRRVFYFEFHYSSTSNGFRLSFCRETEEKRRR
jgi:hypothetical protein